MKECYVVQQQPPLTSGAQGHPLILTTTKKPLSRKRKIFCAQFFTFFFFFYPVGIKSQKVVVQERLGLFGKFLRKSILYTLRLVH